MSKTTNIIVKEVSVRTLKVNGTDYISISDIAKQKKSNRTERCSKELDEIEKHFGIFRTLGAFK